MKNIESKPLSSFIFIPLLSLIFLRPFFSGLAYPTFELYYENLLIFLAIVLCYSLKAGFQSGRNSPFRVSSSPYNLPILLLLASYITATIFSVNIHNSIKETIKFISYISIFFIVLQTDENQKNALIKTLVTAAVIISIYSIYQYFWGFQHTLDYLKKTNNGLLLNSSYARDILISKRSIGTFPSPNILGGYLIMIFFLSLSLRGVQTPKVSGRRSNLVFIFLPILIIASLLLTKSLGAWLSLTAALFILFLLSCKSAAQGAATTGMCCSRSALRCLKIFEILYNKFLKQRSLILISSFVIITLALSFILLTRWERLTNLANPQNSITQRFNYWRTAIAIIRDHPFLGVGPGNFQEVFLKYKVGLSTDTRYAHNILLHIWAETGLSGFIGIVFLIIIILRNYKPERKYFFLAGLAFLFHNLIDNTYFIPEAGFLWWVLLGIAI